MSTPKTTKRKVVKVWIQKIKEGVYFMHGKPKLSKLKIWK